MRRTTIKTKTTSTPTVVQRKAIAKFDEATELAGRLLAALQFLEDHERDGRPIAASFIDEIVQTVRRINRSEVMPALVGYLLLRMSAEPGKEPPPSEDGDAELCGYRSFYAVLMRRLDDADTRARGPARH